MRAAFCGLVLMIAAALQGCGGAQASGPYAEFSGGAAGYGNGTVRDVTNASGGQPGNVNTATTTRTIAGPNITAFEWANVSILDNYAEKGENVAAYFQANKYGNGPTWAAVSEVADRSGASSGLVAHEFDVWTSGPDTGNRIGLDIVLGDVKAIRRIGQSDVVEATAAIRIGAGHAGKWTTGIDLTGRYDVAIDAAKATTATALRLREGQSIELAPGVTLHSRQGRIVFMRDGEVVSSL